MAESFPELMKDINCNSKGLAKQTNKQTKNLTQHNKNHYEN